MSPWDEVIFEKGSAT